MNPRFSINDGELVVTDGASGPVIWQGRFRSGRVEKVVPVPESPDCLVLLDPGSSHPMTFENLSRVGPTGEVKWTAQLPRTHDAFVDVWLTDTRIEAQTWSGSRFEVNSETGSARFVEFTK